MKPLNRGMHARSYAFLGVAAASLIALPLVAPGLAADGSLRLEVPSEADPGSG